MTGGDFGRSLVVGFIATFIATIYGYWEVAFGLPRLDFATLLGYDLAPAEASREFAFALGMTQHFIDGLLFALVFFRLGQKILPGGAWLKGLLFGLLLWVASGLVASPVHRAGLFWSQWRLPAVFAVFLWHVIWGLALGGAFSLAWQKGSQAFSKESEQ